jgi:hypothetical protein
MVFLAIFEGYTMPMAHRRSRTSHSQLWMIAALVRQRTPDRERSNEPALAPDREIQTRLETTKQP